MSKHCPTCGQRLPSVIDVDLTMNAIRRGLHEVRMWPQAVVVVHTLANNAGRLVSYEQLESALWGGADRVPMGARSVIAGYIHRARRSLASMGVRIRTVHGHGYVLTLVE